VKEQKFQVINFIALCSHIHTLTHIDRGCVVWPISQSVDSYITSTRAVNVGWAGRGPIKMANDAPENTHHDDEAIITSFQAFQALAMGHCTSN